MSLCQLRSCTPWTAPTLDGTGVESIRRHTSVSGQSMFSGDAVFIYRRQRVLTEPLLNLLGALWRSVKMPVHKIFSQHDT